MLPGTTDKQLRSAHTDSLPRGITHFRSLLPKQLPTPADLLDDLAITWPPSVLQ
jgi:hypothetical protein